jgi:hypothetical protein
MSPFSPHLVDEETSKNDLDIVREVLKVTREVPHGADMAPTFTSSRSKVICNVFIGTSRLSVKVVGRCPIIAVLTSIKAGKRSGI